MTPTIEELGAFAPLAKLLSVPDGGTIVVAGAYEGKYVCYLAERFPKSTVWGFEPQTEAFSAMCERLNKHKISNVRLGDFGLGTANRSVVFSNSKTDGCSALSLDGETQRRLVHDVVEQFHLIDSQIDLLVLKCRRQRMGLAALPARRNDAPSRRFNGDPVSP